MALLPVGEELIELLHLGLSGGLCGVGEILDRASLQGHPDGEGAHLEVGVTRLLFECIGVDRVGEGLELGVSAGDGKGRRALLFIRTDDALDVCLVLDLVLSELVEELLHGRFVGPIGRHRVEGVAIDLDLISLLENFANIVVHGSLLRFGVCVSFLPA